MKPEQTMNEPTTPPGKIANAESHARACWDALYRHALYCVNGSRCGCCADGSNVTVATDCEVGQVCREEYEIASRRVRELRAKAAAKLADGDFEHAWPQDATREDFA